MKKITIERMKNINNLEFTLPESKGVYLIVGPNGGGKTTLLLHSAGRTRYGGIIELI